MALWEGLGKEPGRKGRSSLDAETLSSSQAECGLCMCPVSRGGVRTPMKGGSDSDAHSSQASWDPAKADFTLHALRLFSLLLIYGMYSNLPCVICVLVLPPGPGNSLRKGLCRRSVFSTYRTYQGLKNDHETEVNGILSQIRT